MSPRRRPEESWPWPTDTGLERARRVAHAYRSALHAHAESVCRELDERMRTFGQTWVLPSPVTRTDEELLTTDEAADYLVVRPRTVDAYRRRGLPSVTTPDGPRYRVGDLRAWQAARRRARRG